MSYCNGNTKTPVTYTRVIPVIISSDKTDTKRDGAEEDALENDNNNSSELEPRQKDYSSSLEIAVSKPTFEDVQIIIGESGKWQLQIVILASFSGFCLSLHALIYGFIGVVPTHQCQVPAWISNDSNGELGMKSFSSNINQSENHCQHHLWTRDNATHTLSLDTRSSVRCTSFTFDNTEFHSTVPTEWNLVCEYAEWVPYIQVAYMLGVLLGSPVCGAVSDRLGRKTTLLIINLIAAIASPLIALANNFGTFLVLRFILGFVLPGIYNCCYVLALEVVPGRWRSAVGSLFNIPFSLGYVALSILAYFLRSWKSLQLACSLPLVLLLGTWWFLPESPRWLIGKGMLDKAEQVFRCAAKVNGNTDKIPPNFSTLLQKIYDMDRSCEEKPKSVFTEFNNAIKRYVTIITSPLMKRIIFVFCFSLTTITLTYYGLGLNSSNLSTDRYSYFFINGLLEFPSYFLVFISLKYFGRKTLFLWLLLTCAAAMFTSVCLPQGSKIIVLLSYLGKLLIGAAYTLSYLYSFELLPTSVRNFLLSVFCMMGSLGSIIAPLIVDGRHPFTYPYLIFGCLTTLAGLISIILPETRNRPLPDALDNVGKEGSKTLGNAQ